MTPMRDGRRSARRAGLHYVGDDGPGIVRRRCGRGFRYLGPDGRCLRDPATLRRIRALAIPPAWREVWINADPLGHIQATARDARSRKQYRYHPRWQEWRSARKYDRLLAFADALGALRARVAADLARPGLARRTVLAGVVRLLDASCVRIGNSAYARDNGSYGLTTLQRHHVAVEGERIVLSFRGKSGRRHRIEVRDARLAALIGRCRKLPGATLFKYLDVHGRRRTVDAAAVNAYLREACGGDFSAKDFRTWAGTRAAVAALARADLERAAGAQLKQALEQVAAQLGNTVAVCRRCYVHPAVFAAHGGGWLAAAAAHPVERAGRMRGLRVDERAMVAVLRAAAGRSDE
ncbi:DNA topoisomerase IB [Chitinimonas koreensis]|uniref:DNA topoisomerase IB n=2 Tax=Chitinimonas koreensis TaxID=356302 RepID=UPI0003FDD90C|nr:DNA topoisomerase IB [Chitinimonas koreensis]